MNLEQFYNTKVKIIAENGRLFEGTVNDYIEPEDNENNEESIIIDTKEGTAVEFYEKDIQTIETIE